MTFAFSPSGNLEPSDRLETEFQEKHFPKEIKVYSETRYYAECINCDIQWEALPRHDRTFILEACEEHQKETGHTFVRPLVRDDIKEKPSKYR